MTTVTRQQITDCVNPDELKDHARAKEFNDHFLWLWGGIVTNDTVNVTVSVKDQLMSMFNGWTETRKALKTLLGA